jgi:hypothetical protein
MTKAKASVLGLAAIVATMSSLFFAEQVGGPLARFVIGPPIGFRQHFTSHSALVQALLVQGSFVCLAFFGLGVVGAGWMLRNISYKQSLWVANPITVGIGFAAYKVAYHSLHLSDYLAEYDSPTIFVLFTLAFSVVFAACFYAGTKLLRSLRTRA